jgi:hypothetical protein
LFRAKLRRKILLRLVLQPHLLGLWRDHPSLLVVTAFGEDLLVAVVGGQMQKRLDGRGL